jgi:hypothetical protein
VELSVSARNPIHCFSGKKQYAIVLGNTEIIEDICEKATFYHVDATFGVLPGHIEVLKVRSSQVLNLAAEVGSALVCVLTVIMSCRKVGLYRAIYRYIKERFPNLQPKDIMADWEPALRKTLGEYWPDAHVLGCW